MARRAVAIPQRRAGGQAEQPAQVRRVLDPRTSRLADRPDRDAARTIAFHPEQGWSLLCNGVIVFDDVGEILPDGRVVPPHHWTRVRPFIAALKTREGTRAAVHHQVCDQRLARPVHLGSYRVSDMAADSEHRSLRAPHLTGGTPPTRDP